MAEVDLLAGSKRNQSAMARAMLLQASTEKSQTWGEALAKALSMGLIGASERDESKQSSEQWGKVAEIAAALRGGDGATPASLGPTSGGPTPTAPASSAQPSPRLPAVGGWQDNQILPESPNDRVAASFGGLTPQGRDIATRTVLGEAANQGPLGMQGVADVIKNRADAGGYRTGAVGPTTMDKVALAPGQFEPWMTQGGRDRMNSYKPTSDAYKTAQAAVDNASIGGQPDVTGGSTFFYSPTQNAQLAARNGDRLAVPNWAAGRQPNTTIGTHQFFAPEGKPAQAIAGQGGQTMPGGNAMAAGTPPSAQDGRMMAVVDLIKDPKTTDQQRSYLMQLMQRPEADFGVIGEDAEGNKKYGWINKRAQTTTPANIGGPSQGDAAPSITLPDGRKITMPEGGNAKEWRKSVTGTVADAQAGKLNESQAKATSFAGRMETAEKVAQQYESAATGIVDNALRSITDMKYSPLPRGATNWKVSPDYQKHEQAKSQFITAMLRHESGAAISPEEFTRYDREYFPQVGDDQSVIEQKRQMRQVAIDGMKKGAGPMYQSPAMPQASQGGWVDVGNGVRIREKR